MGSEMWRTDAAMALLNGVGQDDIQHSFFDVTIVVDDRQFQCSRLLLSAFSSFFHKMFTSEFSEKTKTEVTIKLVTADVFERVHDYMLGRQDVSRDIAVELIDAGSCLQMQQLKVRSGEILIGNISPSDAVSVWRLGREHDVQFLSAYAKTYILKNFDDVGEEDEFLTLDKEELLELLRDDSLHTDNEELIAEAVLRWIEHGENREKNAAEVLENVKFPFTSPGYLAIVTKKHNFLYQDSRCRDILEEAKLYHMLPGERDRFTSKRTENRTGAARVDVMVVLNNQTAEVAAYNLKENNWYNLAPIPHTLYSSDMVYGVCTYMDSIYVTASVSWNKFSAMQYCSLTNSWHQFASLPNTEMHCYSQGIFRNQLILIGGTRSYHQSFTYNDYFKNVTELNTQSGKLRKLGELIVGVGNINTVIVNQQAIVVGGNTKTSEVGSCQIQCFNFVTGQCTIIGNLPRPVTMSGAVPDNDIIYVMEKRAVIQIAFEATGVKITEIVKSEDDADVDTYRDSFLYGGKWYMAGKLKQNILRVLDVRDGSPFADNTPLEVPIGLQSLSAFGLVKLSVPRRILTH